MSSTNSEDDWIRPLSKFECYLEVFHQKGFMISSYSLTLNSKSPLEETHLRKALLHLQRKAPNLSVCIRPKNDTELWFHKMENENIDFKILYNVDDVHKEFEDLSRHHYNSFDGPLWCVRLIPQHLKSSCGMPEIKLQYPHQYVLLFGIHHAVTDGTSNIKICDALLSILNSVIAGEAINDLDKIGEHVSPEETEKLVLESALELMSNPLELEQFRELIAGGVDDVLFLKAFPSPDDVTTKTASIGFSLSQEETSCFIKQCKQEGVTIHAGFCSVINAAIADMLTNADFGRENFVMKAYHTINTRRYWDSGASNTFGAHLLVCSIASTVPGILNIDDFWKNAKTYHSTMASKMANKEPLKEAAAMFMGMESEQLEDRTFSKNYNRPFYYGTTNMGNMTSTFSGEGEHVQVTDFKRTTSTSDNLCSHVMQTFRGRFLYSLDYGKQFMSTETAQLYVDTIFKVLRNVSKSID